MLTVLLLMLFPLACSRQELLSPAEFTQEFARKMADASTRVVVVSALEVEVRKAGGERTRVRLEPAYAQYRQIPKGKDSIIARFIASTREVSVIDSAPVDVQRIVPVIKDRDWMDATRSEQILREDSKPASYVTEPFNGDLIIVYAEDGPSSVRYLTANDLKDAGVVRNGLREMACENLRRILPEVERHETDGILMLKAGGDYESSLLLFGSVWEDLAKTVDGEVVVGVPSRDLVMVAGSNNVAAIRKLREVVEQTFPSTMHPVSRRVFVRREGEFQVLYGSGK